MESQRAAGGENREKGNREIAMKVNDCVQPVVWVPAGRPLSSCALLTGYVLSTSPSQPGPEAQSCCSFFCSERAHPGDF